MMTIAVIGSTGRAGSRIMAEAKKRGHQVKGIARHEENGIKKSLFDLTQNDVKEFDVVVSAFAAWEDLSLHIEAVKHLDTIMKGLNTRWIAVGGAGSLFIAKGLRLKDTEGFPPEYKPVADAMAEGYDYLQSGAGSNWSYFCPAAMFEPGEKTGRYRFGEDDLLVNEKGNSIISMEDYAIAMLDAIEQNRFNKKRFTAVQA